MPSMNRFEESPKRPAKVAAAVVAGVAVGLLTVAATAPVTTGPEAGQTSKVAPAGGFKGMG